MAAPENLQKVAVSVLDSLHEGFQVVDPQWRYVYVNRSVAEQEKRSPEALIGRTLMECHPGIEATPLFAALRGCMTSRQPSQMESEFRRPDGAHGWFELKFLPIPEGVCILSQDITRKKELESQVYQLQKMEAVSRMASAVAHDFNNTLAIIGIYAETLEAELRQKPAERFASQIVKAVERAAKLTRQLVLLSRQESLELKAIDVNVAIAELGGMLDQLLGDAIRLELKLGKGLRPIRIGSGHLEQVLVNLVVNARDAMPAGGALRIETDAAEFDPAYVARLDVAAGRYVCVSVADTGAGMSPDVQARIFDPFFTTKEQGTGLGLSAVYGIVKRHRGWIRVHSEKGAGTQFKIYFPEAEATEAAEPAAPAEVLPPPEGAGRRTILLTEDEPQLREIVTLILEEDGYAVLGAGDAEEAMKVAGAHPGRIHLLLTDVMMPRVSGPQLAKMLTSQRPDLKVLFLSGYSGNMFEGKDDVLGAGQLLEKPFSADALKAKVREILGD